MRSVLAVLGVLLFTGAAGGQSVIPPVGETIDVSIVAMSEPNAIEIATVHLPTSRGGLAGISISGALRRE